MSKVLFVVEGERAEPRFLKKMMGFYQVIDDSEIYTVGTNIHVLYEEMFVRNDPEDMDLLSVLRSMNGGADRKILSNDFSDVFLVFDVEVQDRLFNVEHMRRMLEHFSESTENGKLFLNYPMMESYRHMISLGDEGYLTSFVSFEQIKGYKSLVGSEGCKELRSLSKYGRDVFDMLITMNLRKANLLCEGDGGIPSVERFKELSGMEIFERQVNSLYVEDRLFILNTSLFLIVDYAPSAFLGS